MQGIEKLLIALGDEVLKEHTRKTWPLNFDTVLPPISDFRVYNLDLKVDYNEAKPFLGEWGVRQKNYRNKKIAEWASESYENMYLYSSMFKNALGLYVKGLQAMDMLYEDIANKNLRFDEFREFLLKFVKTTSTVNEILYGLSSVLKDSVDGLADKYSISLNEVRLPSNPAIYEFFRISNRIYPMLNEGILGNMAELERVVRSNTEIQELYKKYGFGSIKNFSVFISKMKEFYEPGLRGSTHSMQIRKDPDFQMNVGIIRVPKTVEELIYIDNIYEMEYKMLLFDVDINFYKLLRTELDSEFTLRDIEEKLSCKTANGNIGGIAYRKSERVIFLEEAYIPKAVKYVKTAINFYNSI